jgi:Ca-activated chloride channel family protein
MNEALHQFHFLRPWWLLAFVLLPLVGWIGVRRSTARTALSRLVDPELLPHLLRGRPGSRQLPIWLFSAAWVLATLALAGPTWSRISQPLYANRAAQVLAISLSQHMLSHDVAPSRLDRVRYKAHDLLASNHDGLNALIGYAGEAFVVAPLTSDANSLSDLLDAMAPDTMPVDGDNAAAAIERGVKLIGDAKAGGGSLVVITDQADAAADAAARKALAAGVHVSVLGVGTSQGAPVPSPDGGFLHDAQGHMLMARRDDASLAALAAAGGGRYVAMTADHRDIDALHAQLRPASSMTSDGQLGDEWQDRGPWLLLPLLLIVALAFRRGWLLMLPLVVLPMLPTSAEATSWHDLWQRPDQQAARALQQGQPQKALQLARDPALRGTAAYRTGDYADATHAFQQAHGTDGAYNLGNALARQAKYPQAIAAYDHALKLDPHNADATANRKAVEDWLKKQDQQKKQGQQKKQDGKPSSGGKGNQQQAGKSGANDKQDASKSQDGKSPQDNGKPSDQGGKNTSSPSSGDQGKQDANKPSASDQPKPMTAEQQAAQKAQAEQAQKALKQQMDKALAASKPPAGKPSTNQPPTNPTPTQQPETHQLGEMGQDDPQSKMPADLRHALQRVPDDPGSLLRRKFQLEYQQRHGVAANEDDQP